VEWPRINRFGSWRRSFKRGAVSVEGKVTVVTGATSGVGRGIAREFARRGAKVVATGRREANGKSLEKAVRADGGELTFVRADVTEEADCENVAGTAVDRYGRLDILVCNAGIVGEPAVVDTHRAPLDWWNGVIATNLTGTFLSCRSALPHMMAQQSGVIITISSINSEVAMSRMAAYNSSKAAIMQFTRTLAVEYLPHGIRANTVILGSVHGGTKEAVHASLRAHASGGEVTAEVTAEELEHQFSAITDEPERVGAALALIASDEMASMTATNIHLDRGVAAGALTDIAIYKINSGQWSMA
jgi:NAD(P)-dependent dehydrogenase (short-subunit alcohol dehydrogenase family)